MTKKIEVTDLKNMITVSKGYVISESLQKTDYIDITEYGFSSDQMLTYEKSGNDKIYIGIKGNVNIDIKRDEDTEVNTQILKPYEFIYIPKGVYREISGEEDYVFVMITLKGDKQMIKNLDKQKILNLSEEIAYQQNKIVSKTIANDEKLTMTLLSFDGKQELSTHSAPGDAMVIALDGEAKIVIDGNDYGVKKGDSVIMPAKVPHGVYVTDKFQMLLIVSK